MKTLIYLATLILLNAVCESARISKTGDTIADTEEDQLKMEQDEDYEDENEIERSEDFEDSVDGEDDDDFATEGNEDIIDDKGRDIFNEQHEIRVRGCYARGIVLDCYYEQGVINIKSIQNWNGRGFCSIVDHVPREPWRNECSELPSKAKAKIIQGCQGKTKCRLGSGGFKFEDHCPNVSKFTMVRYNCTSTAQRAGPL